MDDVQVNPTQHGSPSIRPDPGRRRTAGIGRGGVAGLAGIGVAAGLVGIGVAAGLVGTGVAGRLHRRRLGGTGAASATGATATGRAHRPRRVVVEGASMAPTLLAGDRLLLRRARHPRPGDVVALPDPRHDTRILVKRVRAASAAGLDVRGDDPDASTDSRTFGPVPAASVTGRVVYRYAPAARAGRIGRRWNEEPGRP